MSDARHWLACSLGLGLMLGIAGSCLLEDPDHCLAGKYRCDEETEVCDPCTPSTNKHGCVPIGQDLDGLPNADGCQTPLYPTSEGSSMGSESSSTGVTDPTMTAGTVDTTMTPETTDPSTTTGDPPLCDVPADCQGSTPFCVDGECVGCSTDDPQTMCANDLVCDSSGACVVCNEVDFDACGGMTPYCDPGTNTCVPCTEHAHCGMAACNLFTGECVPGEVVNVVPGAGALDAALDAVGSSGTIIMANGTYDEAVTVGSAATIAFLAAPTASPEWRRTVGVGAPHLRVTGGATVLIDGVDFRLNNSNTDPAIRVDSAGTRFWADRSTIAQNFGVGVRGEGAQLVMRNCFVGGANNIDALEVTGGMTQVLFSTLGGAFGSSNAISCDATALVRVSDSILIAQDSTAEVACDTIMADHTATNDMVLDGEGNQTRGPTAEAWFEDYGTGDFHLVGDGPATFMDIAQWNTGDLTADIDGDPRGGVDNQSEYAGADVP